MNYNETETLKEVVDTTTELKKWLVNYVGEKHDPENGEVTVEMIVETIAIEFPEFLMAIAEENWVRGYHQALNDVDIGREAVNSVEKQEYEQQNI